MDIGFMITIFVIGFIGSFISGMAGIGGSIINYPMLLYIPPFIGIFSLTAHEVTGITAVQVFFATISGVMVYRKGGYLNKTLIVYMGTSILAGSFIGSTASKLMTAESINIVYGALAIIASVLMFVPKKGLDNVEFAQVSYNKWLAAFLALLVGVSAGIVGAGGAFLLVPIMLTILKIPTKMTVATSLAITFMSSIGSIIGKAATGQILLLPALILMIASLLSAPIGATIGKKINAKLLQVILAGLIAGVAVKIWFDLLF
ncbi:sulfite exporter TauE/SafE family protein [Bacillus taeanensis]|uniref:Probable membrane transporter protein n=1 Tax=Bacillus taeanensis TaxID=273032 RepID=A0A366XYG1_9BACI|nr:sulfite exporter TauE/SafE family protein [Bacillus taeanensis]RBW68961.1 sulfite exporter TauE/SafE family protein [Bacillus taeanensis]